MVIELPQNEVQVATEIIPSEDLNRFLKAIEGNPNIFDITHESVGDNVKVTVHYGITDFTPLHSRIRGGISLEAAKVRAGWVL